jgi:hypothetical protein
MANPPLRLQLTVFILKSIYKIRESLMLQKQIFEEIKQIPSEKLPEIYDLIHYFRIGLMHEGHIQHNSSPVSFSARWVLFCGHSKCA